MAPGRRTLLLLLLAGGCRTAGPPTVTLEPLTALPPGGAALGEMAFLTGCWRGRRGGDLTIEERWTPPAGQLMMATTRYLENGAVTDFEFSTLAVEDGLITLTPYPGGNRSADSFRLTAKGPGRAVFEAPQHDYPKRILYSRDDGTLLARIDAGEDDPEPRTWRMDAVSCP